MPDIEAMIAHCCQYSKVPFPSAAERKRIEASAKDRQGFITAMGVYIWQKRNNA